jgi:hypothetical protein
MFYPQRAASRRLSRSPNLCVSVRRSVGCAASSLSAWRHTGRKAGMRRCAGAIEPVTEAVTEATLTGAPPGGRTVSRDPHAPDSRPAVPRIGTMSSLNWSNFRPSMPPGSKPYPTRFEAPRPPRRFRPSSMLISPRWLYVELTDRSIVASRPSSARTWANF